MQTSLSRRHIESRMWHHALENVRALMKTEVLVRKMTLLSWMTAFSPT